ncbi:MAG: hypothetical protein OEY11_10360 [Gammaproteobacteria bacterium]|nr:hypothetical protein [Gammaproteobacteria bacterium]
MDITSETKTIYEFVDKGNYHAAMNISISALNASRRNDDQTAVNVFLGIIKDIANIMATEFGS